MGTVIANTVPCTDCEGTGKCTTCGGKGELDNGEVCEDCHGGLCMACEGSGQDLEFTVDGTPVTSFTRYWKRWLTYGPVTIGFAAFFAFAAMSGWVRTVDSGFVLIVALLAGMGGFLTVWGLRLRDLQLQMDRLWETYHAQTEGDVEAAEEALETRRRWRGRE